MRVLNIDHDAGSPPAAPRAATSAAAARSSSTGISLTRLAWFDANGDGRIDTRAAGAGGDATLLVPTHEVDLPTYGRAAAPRLDGRPMRAEIPNAGEPAGTATPPVGNAVQTQRAVDAYQRYGQAPAPAAGAPTAVADATSAAVVTRA
jgi:hypothetical protein